VSPELPRRAVVLLSGGLDSATTLAIAQADGLEAHALTVRYGQRHAHEVQAARRVAQALGAASHRILDLDLRAIGGSALTGDLPVPKNRSVDRIAREIPPTYVPARNTIFLALALAWAEVLHAERIYLGVNALDYSGYPDCRPQFLAAFEQVSATGTKAGVEGHPVAIAAPLVAMGKADIIRTGLALGVDYGLTHSCYDPNEHGAPCGACDACLLRREGFRAAGVDDPIAVKGDGT